MTLKIFEVVLKGEGSSSIFVKREIPSNVNPADVARAFADRGIDQDNVYYPGREVVRILWKDA